MVVETSCRTNKTKKSFVVVVVVAVDLPCVFFNSVDHTLLCTQMVQESLT